MTTITDTSDVRVLTVDQRAGFLLELADHVENERRWAKQPFTDALPGIVPAVAAVTCPDPLGVFHELVDAVEQQRRFDRDERGYADEHDWPTTETALIRLRARLQSNVDCALQRLLGGVS